MRGIFFLILLVWRHNGFFKDFLCGTLTLPNWEQFSSNWYITTLAKDIVRDCKPTFSVDFFNSIWPIKMAKMTVKINICVKIKTKHFFVLISSRWWRIWPYFTPLALLPSKITEKNGENRYFKYVLQHKEIKRFYSKSIVKPSHTFSNGWYSTFLTNFCYMTS